MRNKIAKTLKKSSKGNVKAYKAMKKMW